MPVSSWCLTPPTEFRSALLGKQRQFSSRQTKSLVSSHRFSIGCSSWPGPCSLFVRMARASLGSQRTPTPRFTIRRLISAFGLPPSRAVVESTGCQQTFVGMVIFFFVLLSCTSVPALYSNPSTLDHNATDLQDSSLRSKSKGENR